jgi:hypothetical protein
VLIGNGLGNVAFGTHSSQQNEPMFWLLSSIGLVLFIIGLIFALVLPYSKKEKSKDKE